MKCEHIQELILTDHMDGEMGDAQNKQFEQHLQVCAGCRQYAALARQAAAEPFENAGRIHPPEHVWHRIKARIEEEQDSAKGIRNIFTIPKSVYALSAAMLILIMILTKMFLFDPNGTQLANGISDEIEIYEYLTEWDPSVEFDVAFGTDTEAYFL